MIQAIISSIITVAVLVTGFLNMPASWLGFENEKFGTLSFTDLSGTDTMSDFPTKYNADISTMNLGKMDAATTSVNSITTLSNLVTIGTIGTGVWNADAIGVAYGGTGTTSPSIYHTMIGDGAAGLTHASSTGTSGQFWTSGGAGAYPSWTTSAVSQADSYNWTGGHTFTSASTTFLGATLVGIGTSTPYARLSVVGETVSEYFTATSTTGTSTFPNLDVTTNATTSNLFIGGTVTGGPMDYTASSTAYTCSSGTCTYTGSIPTNANIGVTGWFVDGAIDYYGFLMIMREALTSVAIGDDAGSSTDWKYTFSWSGANFTIVENTDNNTGAVSGTIYWLK